MPTTVKTTSKQYFDGRVAVCDLIETLLEGDAETILEFEDRLRDEPSLSDCGTIIKDGAKVLYCRLEMAPSEFAVQAGDDQQEISIDEYVAVLLARDMRKFPGADEDSVLEFDVEGTVRAVSSTGEIKGVVTLLSEFDQDHGLDWDDDDEDDLF